MKKQIYSSTFTLLLPIEQAFILCVNHMNFISSHKLQNYSKNNSEAQSFDAKLRMPGKLTTETLNFKLQKIAESETAVAVTSSPSLPINSYDFPATKKVLHYLQQHKAYKDNDKTAP